MSEQISLVSVIDRLAKLEGLLVGLQNSIVQGQSQTSAFMTRIERLEQRQVEIEKTMVTDADIAALTTKVDALITADAKQQGGTAIASWSINTLAAWGAILISLFTLIGLNVDFNNTQQQQQLPQINQKEGK